MAVIKKRITIVRIRHPPKQNLNEELKWLGSSLGLFGERDRDKSCFRLFIELLKAAKTGQGLSSDELAARTKLSRGTVVHHLQTLIERGLVIPIQRKYILREPRIEALIRELESDFVKAVEELRHAAREIDTALGL